MGASKTSKQISPDRPRCWPKGMKMTANAHAAVRSGSNAAKPEKSARLPYFSRVALKRIGLCAGLAAGMIATGGYGYHYWATGQYLESTDDAYIKADYTTVAPKVSGHIAEVLVEDNQHVKAGEILALIDGRDFATSLEQAGAAVRAADATISNLNAQIELQHSVVRQAMASIAASEASQKFAREERDRYQNLMRTGHGTVQRAQQTEALLLERTAELRRDRAGLVAAERKIDVLATERDVARAHRDRSRALERQAALNLSYTTVRAPVDGTVGARSIRVGQYVQAGTQLMAVVPLHAVYVVANFKETQLAYVRDGQPVDVKVDSFPGTTLTGRVDSVSPASGLEFSLLPPDNATGNFTKIVQRIPVKITLDDNVLTGILRAGMSVEPTIDTKATVLAGGIQTSYASSDADRDARSNSAGTSDLVGYVANPPSRAIEDLGHGHR